MAVKSPNASLLRISNTGPDHNLTLVGRGGGGGALKHSGGGSPLRYPSVPHQASQPLLARLRCLVLIEEMGVYFIVAVDGRTGNAIDETPLVR